MAFLIEDIRTTSPKPGQLYLFDANVWLAVLDINFTSTFSQYYTNFFEEVLKNNLQPKASIVIPSLLLSEIMNRLMNDIYYKEFCLKNPKPESISKATHYKKTYRTSKEYQYDFSSACQSIRSYHQHVKLLSDHLDKFTFKALTKKIPLHLDFNDHIYCQIAKSQNLAIVTADKDYSIDDIIIITSNPHLLQLRK